MASEVYQLSRDVPRQANERQHVFDIFASVAARKSVDGKEVAVPFERLVRARFACGDNLLCANGTNAWNARGEFFRVGRVQIASMPRVKPARHWADRECVIATVAVIVVPAAMRQPRGRAKRSPLLTERVEMAVADASTSAHALSEGAYLFRRLLLERLGTVATKGVISGQIDDASL